MSSEDDLRELRANFELRAGCLRLERHTNRPRLWPSPPFDASAVVSLSPNSLDSYSLKSSSPPPPKQSASFSCSLTPPSLIRSTRGPVLSPCSSQASSSPSRNRSWTTWHCPFYFGSVTAHRSRPASALPFASISCTSRTLPAVLSLGSNGGERTSPGSEESLRYVYTVLIVVYSLY